MIAAPLLALLLGPPDGPADPRPASALIEGLGNPSYSRREAASGELRAQGKSALPALIEAQKSRDPEVRDRAGALIAQIRRDDLLGPTLVPLDFRDRTVGEVARTLSERSGFPIEFHPAADTDRKITLLSDDPVPFWAALEQLMEVAAVREDRRTRARFVGNNLREAESPDLTLMPLGLAGPAPPTWIDGKFRVRLQRAFEAPPPDFAIAGRRAQPRVDIDPSAPSMQVMLEVAAEPQTTVVQAGPARILEAIDAKEKPIVVVEEGFDVMMARGFGRWGRTTLAETDRTSILIRLAADPSQTLARFRGKVPVTISKFQDPPVAIDLAGATGKTFEFGDTTIRVVDFAADLPNRTARLELALRINPAKAGDPEAASRMGSPWPDLKIVDEDGNVPRTMPEERNLNGQELQRAWSYRGLRKPPARLLVRAAERAVVEVSFEFRNVKLTGDVR